MCLIIYTNFVLFSTYFPWMIKHCEEEYIPLIGAVELLMNYVFFLLASLFFAPSLSFFLISYVPIFMISEVYLIIATLRSMSILNDYNMLILMLVQFCMVIIITSVAIYRYYYLSIKFSLIKLQESQ